MKQTPRTVPLFPFDLRRTPRIAGGRRFVSREQWKLYFKGSLAPVYVSGGRTEAR